MKTKLNSMMIAGLTAAALTAALVAATPAQAESRTFVHGTYGSAKYDGVAATHLRKSFNRSAKRNRAALRTGRTGVRHNFSAGNRYRSQIKISR